jgi:hypothetical protein
VYPLKKNFGPGTFATGKEKGYFHLKNNKQLFSKIFHLFKKVFSWKKREARPYFTFNKKVLYTIKKEKDKVIYLKKILKNLMKETTK